jgi:hypothetical protein
MARGHDIQRSLKALPRASDRHAAIAVFGKLPALGSDHLDEGLGPGANACAPTKFRLYNRGVPEALASELWRDPNHPHRIPGFDHLLIEYSGPAVVVGRLTSASDAVGRSLYPFVTLVATCGLAMDEAMTVGAKAIHALAARLPEARSQTDVSNATHDVQRVLERAIREPQSDSDTVTGAHNTDEEDAPPPIVHADLPPPGKTALLRMYVPPETPSPALLADACRRVHAFDDHALDDVLAFRPAGQPWLDLIIGPPATQELVCLLATPDEPTLGYGSHRLKPR